MSNQTFSPRKVEKGAWRLWHKDAVRLMGRLGLFWIVLWCGGLPALAYVLFQAFEGTIGYLISMYFMQVLGVLAQPVLAHALDKAASGHPPAPAEAFKSALLEITANPKWFLLRMGGQMVALVVFLLFLLVLITFLSSASANGAPAPSVNAPYYNGMVNLVICMVLTPIVLRMGGMMGFYYYLRIRHGLDTRTSIRLNAISEQKNGPILWISVLSVFAIFLIVSNMGLLSLFLLPALHWYHAAYLRCAYHDIFEGGTGVEEKVAQTNPGLSPVIQV